MRALLQFRGSPRLSAWLQRQVPAWLEVAMVDPTDRETFLREMAPTEVLLHVLDPVTDATMQAAPRLRLIQKIGVGVNTIDREAARARGIAVANMPGTNSQAVAEHTLALMLAVMRRLTHLDQATRQGQGWRLPADALDAVGEISGSKIGFVGFGAVPQRLAPALQALGAQVFYWARSDHGGHGAIRLPALEALLREIDIVSLHVPLTDETAQLLDAEKIGWIRPGGVLINCARGELVDETALHAALASGALAGAGADVFAREPCDPGHPLLQLPNFVATPHIAWLTRQTLERSLGVAVENCRRLRDGEPLLHQIR